MKNVLIFGGTHGNEWTGIAVIKNYETYFKEKYPNLRLKFIHSNPEAYKINKRFKDEDLNRAFEFVNEKRSTYENQRARELKEIISKEDCFIIDIHTTTSNMGKTVILSHYHPLNLKMAEAITKTFSDARVIGAPDPNKKYLASQSETGLMIEVGPVANGLVEPKTLKQTLELLDKILFELSSPSVSSGEFPLYEEVEDIYYPQNEAGELIAFIHPDFQDKDFAPVSGEYKAFETFTGKSITHKTSEILYPIFINEAAYYPRKLAYTLCKKVSYKV